MTVTNENYMHEEVKIIKFREFLLPFSKKSSVNPFCISKCKD